MIVRVYGNDLKDAFNRVSCIIPKRTVFDSARTIELRAENGEITMTAANYERRVSVQICGTIEQDGVAYVDAENFKKLCNIKDDVRLSTGGTSNPNFNGVITVQRVARKTQVPLSKVEELLDLDTTGAAILFDAPAKKMVERFNKLTPFLSCDTGRPILGGYNLNTVAGRIEACDGYKLAVAIMQDACFAHRTTESCVVPHWVAADLKKICCKGYDGGNITIRANDKFVRFSGTDYTYTVRKIQGDFLNVGEQLKEKVDMYHLTVDAADYAEVLKEYRDYKGGNDVNVVYTFINNGMVHFYFEAPGFTTSNFTDYVGLLPRGTVPFYAFDAKKLFEAVKIFDKESVDMYGEYTIGNTNTSIKPIFFADGGEYATMVLPVRGTKTLETVQKFCET